MTATYFLAYLGLVLAGVTLAAFRAWPRRRSLQFAAGLGIWIAYVGVMSWSGIVAKTALRPPPALLVVLPAFAVVVVLLALLPIGRRVALSFPLWLLLLAQSFRIGVELFLHRLWTEGMVPRLMTYEGGNVDILVGLSAPVVAWVSTLAQVWNVVGMGALANIVVRAAITAPGRLQILEAELPNLALGTFPYTFIAAFFAPLAFALHVLAMRNIRARLQVRPTAFAELHEEAAK